MQWKHKLNNLCTNAAEMNVEQVYNTVKVFFLKDGYGFIFNSRTI